LYSYAAVNITHHAVRLQHLSFLFFMPVYSENIQLCFTMVGYLSSCWNHF